MVSRDRNAQAPPAVYLTPSRFRTGHPGGIESAGSSSGRPRRGADEFHDAWTEDRPTSRLRPDLRPRRGREAARGVRASSRLPAGIRRPSPSDPPKRDAAPSLFLPGGIRFHAIPSGRPLVRPLEPGRTSDRGAGIDRNLARGDAGPPAAEPLADPRGTGGCPPRPGARTRRSREGRLQEGSAGRPTRRGTCEGYRENG